jgi:hypothetical protein
MRPGHATSLLNQYLQTFCEFLPAARTIPEFLAGCHVSAWQTPSGGWCSVGFWTIRGIVVHLHIHVKNQQTYGNSCTRTEYKQDQVLPDRVHMIGLFMQVWRGILALLIILIIVRAIIPYRDGFMGHGNVVVSFRSARGIESTILSKTDGFYTA